ncbi:MAG: hypothetical protein GC146_04990 [Limimaricola sp.]|uniref:hypothetical protein n=1 Tax=Limimaricola sp. TaxID=2211665 RepID=UPI001DCB1618|nr:hypothetical protein [Limimaricola sp.]MBI1416562.1 hypothetical protein [Limimaricola sp.]
MQPNFALSLSSDGISLLHRVTGGWHVIDEVSFDIADLDARLALMRRNAVALDPRGLRTKLILPNDQIRYMTLPATKGGEAEVRAALDGATPYKVDDLVYDLARTPAGVFVAAVARETLTEAESFAVTHKFAPVSFVAIAPPGAFAGEVFFGATAAAPNLLGPGESPERDREPVRVLGKARVAEPPPPPPAGSTPVAMAAAAVERKVQQKTPEEDPQKAGPDAAETATAAPSPADAEPEKAEPQDESPAAEPAKAASPATPPAEKPADKAAAAARLSIPSRDVPPASRPAPVVTPRAETAAATPAKAEVPKATPPAEKAAAAPAKTEAPEVTPPKDEAPKAPAPKPAEPEPVFVSRTRPLQALRKTSEPSSGPVAPAATRPSPIPPAPAADPRGGEPKFATRNAPRGPMPWQTPSAGTAIPPPLPGSKAADTPPKAAVTLDKPPAASARPLGVATDVPPAAGPRLGAASTGAPAPRAMPSPMAAPRNGPQNDQRLNSAPVTAPNKPAPSVAPPPGIAPLLSAGKAASPKSEAASPSTAKVAAPSLPPDGLRRALAISAASRKVQKETAAEQAETAAQMTVFGARKSAHRQRIGGKPRYLGLILTVLLLLFLAIAAAWASVTSPQVVMRWLGLSRDTAVASADSTASDPVVPGIKPVARPTATQADATAPDAAVSGTVPPAPALTDSQTMASATGNVITDTPTPEEEASADLADLGTGAADAGATATADASAADTASSDTGAASPGAAPDTVASAAPTGQPLTPDQASQAYAATGVWQRTPSLPTSLQADPGTGVGADAGAAPMVRAGPVPLPNLGNLASDVPANVPPLPPPQPAAPATAAVAAADAARLVPATPDGAVTPSGALVIAGKPTVIPPLPPRADAVATGPVPPAPDLTAPPATASPSAAATDSAPAASTEPLPAEAAPPVTVVTAGGVDIQPLARPDTATTATSAAPDTAPLPAVFGNATRADVQALPPKPRPDNLVPASAPGNDGASIAAPAPDAFASATALAVAVSAPPDARPANFDSIVAAARPAQDQAAVDAAVQQAAAASSAPAIPPNAPRMEVTGMPTGPVPGGVARAATDSNAIRLRQISLLGVTGTSSNRAALIRLPSGSVMQVKVGDALDGGQVVAIGENLVNYVKGGRTISLQMPPVQ